MKIEEYNSKVQNWDFERSDLRSFLQLLTDRNLEILSQTEIVDFHYDYTVSSRNKAVIEFKKISFLEYVAFHVGFPHQRRLYSLIDEFTNHPCNEGVFFSLKPQDVNYFSEFNTNPLLMVYLLDVVTAKDLIVQANYDKSVISKYDLDTLLEEQINKKSELYNTHKILNIDWIKQNTAKFDIKDFEDLRRKGHD